MSGASIKAVAACIRGSFAEGLDEGTSMDIARRIAALPDEAAAPSPTAARREAVRQSIIRQISDNGPDLDQTKLPAADWNVVLASLGPPAPFEDGVDTVWSLLVEAGDENSRYTAEKIVEALADAQPVGPPSTALRSALLKARHYVERKSRDAFDDREDQLLAVIDAALWTDTQQSHSR